MLVAQVANHYNEIQAMPQGSAKSERLYLPTPLVEKLTSQACDAISRVKTRPINDLLKFHARRSDNLPMNSVEGTTVHPDHAADAMASKATYATQLRVRVGLSAHVKDHAQHRHGHHHHQSPSNEADFGN